MNILEALDKEGYIIHNIKGISMLPLFVQDEDLVLVEKLKNKPDVLDMVLYKRENQEEYVLHRILDIKDKYYLICGDNQNQLEKVYLEQIIGKVTGYYKKKRFVSINDQEYLDYLKTLQLDLDKRIHLTLISKDIKDFIGLINANIHNKQIDQNSFNFTNIYKLADKHNLIGFIFNSIDSNVCPKEIYNKFKDAYNLYIQRSILFDNERKNIFNLLNINNIKYIPLKGNTISNLYPKQTCRYSTDIDIYIEENSLIKQLMLDSGYEIEIDNVNQYVFKKNPIYNVEFHKHLAEAKMFPYFNDLFKIAILNNNYEYKLSNEDFICFFLAHMYKHNESSVGIRFYLDFYYIHNKLNHDQDKLKYILETNNLLNFYNYVLNTCDLLFNKEELPILELNNMFVGSTFGSREYNIERQIQKQGKFKYILQRLFPSKDD